MVYASPSAKSSEMACFHHSTALVSDWRRCRMLWLNDADSRCVTSLDGMLTFWGLTYLVLLSKTTD